MNRVPSVLAALALSACGSLDHSNPYDPSTPPALQARARLSGRVSLEAGAAAPVLSGVHVSIPGTSLSADTDATGAYSISGVPPGSWSLQAVRAGWEDGFVTGVVVGLDDGNKDVSVPLLALKLARGQVSGNVSLELENTSGGVSISLGGIPGSVVTDLVGDFLIAGVPVGTYTLTASKVGFKDTSVASVLVQAGQATILTSIRVPYDPGGFSGAVLVVGAGSSGGVTIRASGTTLNGTPYEATTVNRPDGTYLFSGLPAGTYNVGFELANYSAVSTAGTVAPGMVTALPPVSLVRDTGSVAGVARLRSSTDHVGIQVTLTPRPSPGDPTPSPAAAAVTGSGGDWRVDGLPVGDYDVAYSKEPGYLAVTGTVTVVSHALVLAASVELADIPGLVQGRVLLEGKAPGALDGTSVHEQSGPPVLTAADGTYSLGVTSGARTIVFDRAGYDTQRVQVAVSPGVTLSLADVTLAISRGGLQGAFRLAGPAGYSSAGVVVTASLSGGTFSTSTVTDGAGAFQLAGLPVGTYTVTGRKDPDWQPQAVAGVVVNPGAVTSLPGSPVTLSPVASASLAGTVLQAGAATHSGTTVTLTGTDFRGVAVGPSTTTTAASGAWTMGGLQAGSYQVQYALTGYDPAPPVGLSLATAQAVSLGTTTLQVSTGTVAGAVSLSAGAAAGFPVGADRSGSVVTLTAPDGTVRTAVTDAAGSYRFDGVPVSLTGAAHGISASRPFYLAASGSVTVVAHATATAPGLTLTVDLGAVSGIVTLWDNVGGAGANPTSSGATVSLVGTAFNGVGWSASAITAANGAFTAGDLPPGSYDVTASSANRTCEAFARATVTPGGTAAAGSVQCVDAVAPTAVSLGAPVAPAGGLSGYTASSSVAVPIALQAGDATSPQSNLRGYQLVVGSAADWSQAILVAGTPATLTFNGLTPNAANLLWVRALDWAGNAGPVASAQVVQDSVAPPVPTISTPRPSVDGTTTSVTLSGSEADANFGGYEVCSISQAAASTCAATPPAGCSWAATSPSFALSLAANQRTCLYARAWDRAGTRSAASSLGVSGVVSDLIPPTPPGFVPRFDPQLLTVRAPWVDFFLDVASTDAPAGTGAWSQVAWIDVDTGAGFEPLCPADACHAGGSYSPCAAACSCTDARLLCDGTRFAGVRVPLLEGSANAVAFRAVDMAGNVGSGVGQQVNTDSSGDLLAGTVALDGNPVIRGNLVTFHSWVPGAGNPHGVVLDLGADHRGQASDRRCDLPGSVSSGYNRGIVPVGPVVVGSGRAVLVADGTGKMTMSGLDDVFCTADDATITFRTPPANYFVRGVSGVFRPGVGEVVGWFEDYAAIADARVYVRERGTDIVFGTGDDPITLLGTFNYTLSITMGDRATLVHFSSCGAGCATTAWRVYNANSLGGYTSGVTQVDLPAAATHAALSPDGRKVAWAQAGALWVRSSGPNGVFDAADDTTASMTIPAAWGLSPAGGDGSDSAVAVDGTHVIMLGAGPAVGWVVHWWAGTDGTFGTADDTLQRIHPAAGLWGIASLASSYAVFAEGDDIRAIDLSHLRWEVTPQAGLSMGQALAADGRGHLLYRTGDWELRARSPAGAETAAPSPLYGSIAFEAQGTDLLTAEYNQLVVRNPGASGAWFSPGAPAPVTVYTGGPTSFFTALALGGGKAIATEAVGSNAYRFRILEPGSGTLATLPTTGAVVDPLGVDQGWALAAGITTRQAFFTCNGIATDLCVLNAGPDGRFGTADDTTQAGMLHPLGSPRYIQPVHDVRAFRVSGRRMLLAEFSPPALYLFEALGANGLFQGGAPDRGRKLADGYFAPWDIALTDEYAAFVAEGSPVGPQVYLVRNFDDVPLPVTAYSSPKASLALDPSGRVFWVDSVFAPEAVFVRAP